MRIWTGIIVGLMTIMNIPSGSTSAQQPQQPHRASTEITYASRENRGGGVTQAELSNGMTVIVRENHAAPVATVRSYVRFTGSVYEGKYLGAGISHLVEHLVAGGSNKKRSEKQIEALVDSLGGQTNAYTSNNVTAYHIDCPAKQASLAIELIADGMQFATFPEEEYRRELGVVQRELEMGEADRSRVLYQAMKQLVFTEHPMRLPIIGYLPVLQDISRDDVIAFYQHHYVPQHMVFAVVGDVDTDKVLDDVLASFRGFHRTTERAPVLPVEPNQASPRSTTKEMPGATTHYSQGWPTVQLQNPDLYPLDVASYLLTNGNSARLTQRLRIQAPLAISVTSASYTPGFVKGWFDITVQAKPENIDKCRAIIAEEIKRLQTTLASPAELDKVKRQKSADHVFGQLTVQAQAEALARSFMSSGDPLFDEQYVAGIQSVTAEQVREVAQRYLRPERLNTVRIEPAGSEAGRTQQDPSASTESKVVRKVLPNGLVVLLKRHSVLPMVSVQAFVKGGVISDTPDTSGRASLASRLMTRGTQKYDALQIAEYFDSIGGSISVSSQRNTSFLQSRVLSGDLVPSLDYVHQVLFRPTFPKDEFQKVQQLQLGSLAARLANPQTEILDFFTRQLPAKSPYSRTVLGTQETVRGLTVEDCRQFQRQYFVPNNMVLAIFGDIDLDDTLALVEKYFGNEPKSPDFSFPTFAKAHEAQAEVVKQLTTQQQGTSMVMIGYPTVSVSDGEEQAALELLNTLLTGGRAAGGRLFHELRGARLVYYVFGFQVTGMAPGYFNFLAQTRPETAQEVVERIQANINQISEEGIAAEDFEKAREKLLAAHALQNTTPSSQAFQACIDELYGLGYQYDKSFDERIGKVTAADVQKVVQKYFRNPIIVTTVPEKK